MSKIITTETTLDQLAAYLDAHGVSYDRVEHDGGALRIGSLGLLVCWDEVDPGNAGWAWRFGDESGALDSLEELDRLAGIAPEPELEPEELYPYPRDDGSGIDWLPAVEGDERT